MELVLRGETDARQHLLAVPSRRACGSAGQRLGDGGRGRRVVFPCRAQHGVRGLDGDERLGQAMAHRLELADELTELSSLQCVSPGQLQHLPGGADQFIPHGQLAQRDRGRPRRGRQRLLRLDDVQGGGDLDQFELGVHTVNPAHGQGRRGYDDDHRCVTVPGDHDRLFVVA